MTNPIVAAIHRYAAVVAAACAEDNYTEEKRLWVIVDQEEHRVRLLVARLRHLSRKKQLREARKRATP
jgi:hypothetical protein